MGKVHFCHCRARENIAEHLLGLSRLRKMLLVGRLIGLAGRDGDAVQAHRRHLVEEGGDALRLGIWKIVQLIWVRKPRSLDT